MVSGALDRLTTALEDIQKVQKENDTDDSDSDSSEDSDGDASEENEVGRRQEIRRNEVAKVTKNKSSRHASKKNSISQKKSSTVKYDIHGHKIRSKKIRKSRVEYDLNGHVVRRRQDEESSAPAPRPSSPHAASPRTASPRESVRKQQATDLARDDVRLTPTDKDIDGQMEYFYDPSTGNRYRVLSAGPRPCPSPGLDTKQFDIDGTVHSPEHSYVPEEDRSMSMYSHTTANSRHKSFYKTMSVAQPMTEPPLTEAEAQQKRLVQMKQEEAVRRAEALSGHQPVTRNEYSLVYGDRGVQWECLRVPVDPYVHPDISYYRPASGEKEQLAQVDDLLPKVFEQEVQNPNKAGIDALSHGVDLYNPNVSLLAKGCGIYDDINAHGEEDTTSKIDSAAREHAMRSVLGVVGGKNEQMVIKGEKRRPNSTYTGPTARALGPMVKRLEKRRERKSGSRIVSP